MLMSDDFRNNLTALLIDVLELKEMVKSENDNTKNSNKKSTKRDKYNSEVSTENFQRKDRQSKSGRLLS